MSTYKIPRNVKGEGRILYIFSTKALIYSTIGAAVGALIYLIFKLINLSVVGIIAIGVLALIGFVIGTCPVPNITTFQITRKTGGENMDDVIKRAIMFKQKKNRIYVYQGEEENK